MIKVQSSQKIFTDAEAAGLTGICVAHLDNFASRRRLGFITRAPQAKEVRTEQRLFSLWDLSVLATLCPPCTH